MDTLLREPEESEVPMSQKQKRQKFNEEFKADAVSLVIEQGYSASNVGKRLGIHHSSISRWVREHQEREGSTDGLSRADIEAENRRLKKEIKRLEMEREILKKAAAFFAKESS